ncbi:MAG: hypothetical protein JRF28_03215, partial [Deltaproteobacteria bacterium]|nr:hypothetical protein [Deltaproteobacteria bacterium]
MSIDLYLRGKELPSVEPSEEHGTEKLPAAVVEKTKTFSRCKAQSLDMDSRLGAFREIVSGLTEGQAVQEAQR